MPSAAPAPGRDATHPERTRLGRGVSDPPGEAAMSHRAQKRREAVLISEAALLSPLKGL